MKKAYTTTITCLFYTFSSSRKLIKQIVRTQLFERIAPFFKQFCLFAASFRYTIKARGVCMGCEFALDRGKTDLYWLHSIWSLKKMDRYYVGLRLRIPVKSAWTHFVLSFCFSTFDAKTNCVFLFLSLSFFVTKILKRNKKSFRGRVLLGS